MNQKLRTARSGIVVILTILSIVCLALSLFFTAYAVSYAESSEPISAAAIDGMWRIRIGEGDGATYLPLLDGIVDGTPLRYLDNVTDDDGRNSVGICEGTASDVECFTPYRDELLTIELNPDYEFSTGEKLGEKYNLSAADYDNEDGRGSASIATVMNTTVSIGDAFEATKAWKIIPLVNDVTSSGAYIGNRVYMESANYSGLQPIHGTDVVYNFINVGSAEEGVDEGNSVALFAISYAGGNPSYKQVNYVDESFEVSDTDVEMNETVSNDFLNYTVRRLSAGKYRLEVTAMPAQDDGICYVANKTSYSFEVARQLIADSNNNLNSRFAFDITWDRTNYTGDLSCISDLGIKLTIDGDTEMLTGMDFTTSISNYNVGWHDLTIQGIGNLDGTYVIKSAFFIAPTDNEWDVLPNISGWDYKDYDKSDNKIQGRPKYLENLNDITFRVVRVDEYDNTTVMPGLEGFHYVVDTDEQGNDVWTVSDTIAETLKNLHAGNYQLLISVYGVNDQNSEEPDRNYIALAERSIDFAVRVSSNNWGTDKVPTIVSWTQGKFDAEVNLITAVDHFGNEAILIIRNGDGKVVFSTHPLHADKDIASTDSLKKLKAGYYTLTAEVAGTEDYEGLNTTITFTIEKNGLPGWAVALIVIGSLGIVAIIFGVLHQKGVLQMLTGKVIISMRTKANVDATLAAIKAAKVAREAEVSIAAAKAREEAEAKAKTEEKK